MAWSKLDDSLSDHPKAIEAGCALALWTRALTWCNRHHTDGAIPARTAQSLSACLASDEFVTASAEAICARLVTVGLWEEASYGYRVHDFRQYHESRADWEARTTAEAARKRRGRPTSGRTPGGLRADSGQRPTGFRATSGRTPGGQASDPTRACTRARASESESESESEIQIPDPELSSLNAPTPPLSLEVESPGPKPRKAKAPKPEPEPLPFTVTAAIDALAEAAGSRFVRGVRMPRGIAMALTGVIRHGVTLEDFRLLGAWLAAGGAAWMRDPPGPSWLTSGRFGEDLARARLWAGSGRHPIGSGMLPATTRDEPLSAITARLEGRE